MKQKSSLLKNTSHNNKNYKWIDSTRSRHIQVFLLKKIFFCHYWCILWSNISKKFCWFLILVVTLHWFQSCLKTIQYALAVHFFKNGSYAGGKRLQISTRNAVISLCVGLLKYRTETINLNLQTVKPWKSFHFVIYNKEHTIKLMVSL